MSAPVTHIEIMGPDRADLVRFYGDVFGWTFEAHDEMNYTIFRVGEGGVGGGIGQDGNTTGVSLFAEVEDLEKVMAHARELGAPETMGPNDIGGGARIAMIKDPAGNVFGLYSGPTTSEPTKGSGAPFSWFDIYGKEPEALSDFYSSLLGWKTDKGSDGYAHVRAEADGIGGGITSPFPGLDNAMLGYVTVGNIEASLTKIETAGGSKFMDRHHVSDGLDIALFKDPAGNLNGLVEYSKKS